MTFFDWVDGLGGQTAAAEKLGFGVVRIHRAFHALAKLDEELVLECEKILGPQFERTATLEEWWRRRRENVELGTKEAISRRSKRAASPAQTSDAA